MKRPVKLILCIGFLIGSALNIRAVADEVSSNDYRVSSFRVDVTIPLGHRCMGILPTKSQRIEDPLEACGFVLQGVGTPIVLVAVDWCELRNGAYDQWREEIAKALDTTRERVLVSCLHQHDAPVADSGAQDLLTQVGLPREMYDPAFHDRVVKKVADAVKESLKKSQPVTHIGIGQAKVSQVASNRRWINAQGKPVFSRGSSSGGNAAMALAPDGVIDPFLKTISFWNNDQPLIAIHSYATHPMSYYGRGGVSADFVGIARRMRQKDQPEVAQIYLTGCAGDVTAGKYNNGSAKMRTVLAERIHQGMKDAWKNTARQEIERLAFRSTPLHLPFRRGTVNETDRQRKTLKTHKDVRQRILAAMALSSMERMQRNQPIDFPALQITFKTEPNSTATKTAFLVLFPGETFIGYQLMAQQMRPDAFVFCIAYGECWPGYIPTEANFADNFQDVWLWVSPGSERAIRKALQEVLYHN